MPGKVDLTDLDMWARAVPYGEFARLREEAPTAWSPGEGGFWSVTRYADIVTASRDVATFSSSRGMSSEDPADEDMAARRTIIDTDPPEHTELRKLVASTFSQRPCRPPAASSPWPGTAGSRPCWPRCRGGTTRRWARPCS